MTCDTSDEDLVNAYAEFVEKIMPSLTTISNELNKLLLANSSKEELKAISAYAVMFRGIEKEVEIFREENVALKTEEQLLEKEYGEIAGAMTVEWEGEELPLPDASSLLETKQRDIRKSMWHCIADRRLQDQNVLDELFNKMVKLRQQIAVNAGYENYRDYKFDELGGSIIPKKIVLVFIMRYKK